MAAAVGLPVLGGVIAVLAVLAMASNALPARAVVAATASLCLVAGLASLAVLLAGGRGQALGGALAIDPFAAFFILPPAIAGLAGAVLARGGVLPATVAAAMLVVLAGDAPTLALAAGVLAVLGRPAAGLAVTGMFLLLGALALLAGDGMAFTAIRAVPPDGVRAGLVLVATVSGVALIALARRRPFAAAPAVELYLLARVLLDLCGPATPEGWGLLLLLLGGGLALAGALSAGRGAAFDDVLVGLSRQHAGWMAAGLGVAAIARAADLLPLAALAAGGAMLHALNHAVFGGLAGLATGTASAAAGTPALDRLGRLARAMPVTGLAMLVAGLSLALLPPSAGFASGWIVLQALFAAPRLGGVPLQLVLTATALALAVSAGLGAVAVVRMGAVTFLGRPRTPRAAAAEDPRGPHSTAMLGLVVLCGLLGLLPGLVLRLTASAQQVISGAVLDVPDGLDGAAIWIVAAAGLALAAAAVLVRRGTLPGARPVPDWQDGFAAAPAWLPFGEPATQVDSGAFATVPAATAWRTVLPRMRLRLEVTPIVVRPGFGIAALFAALVALLLVAAATAPA